MGDYSFSGNSNAGASEDYGNPINKGIYSGVISLATDARTANQVKTTTEKLNTGAKAIEVQLTMPRVAEAIPNQHLDEINRLRKLTGVDLTLHGPLVEPSGIGERGWDPVAREGAERQMWSAVERAHRVNPDGNIVVTLHTSNGLPEPENKVWTDDLTDEEKKKGGRVEALYVINEREGNIGAVPRAKEDYLLDGGKKRSAEEELKKLNEENWSAQLSNVTRSLSVADEYLEQRRGGFKGDVGELSPAKLYDLSLGPDGEKFLNALDDGSKKIAKSIISQMGYGDSLLKDSYLSFQKLYNQAYEVVKKEAEKAKDPSKRAKFEDYKHKLEEYAESNSPTIKKYAGGDRSKVIEVADSITKGIRILESMETPQIFKPIKEFAVDKASETFANVAFQSYSKFGKTAPVLSIENPPAGSGINRAEDMKLLIDESRDKFAKMVMKEKGLSETDARAQAEKLIGATWDVGHINMIRKYGYGDKELVEQTKTIAPYIKNIHLSDNFGMEHTELPMGMGNVPMTEHLAALQKQHGDQLDKIKQVVETGDWYQHFQTTPFAETLESFGSPIYAAKMAPYWNQYRNTYGGYFAGYGMNPDVHHSIYGTGFSNLPVELGGQMSGRSRMSGNPIE